jgi:hypothetical protein
MVAGAALAPFSGGMINPWTASALVGGATGLATGNLKKGLMAGVGAYGGFGLGQGLLSMGTNSAAALSPEVAQSVGQAGLDTAAEAAARQATAAGVNVTGVAVPSAETLAARGQETLANAMAANQPNVAAAAASPYQTMWTGAKEAFSNPSTLIDTLGKDAGKYAMTAAAPAAFAAMQPKKPKEEPEDTSRGTEYDFDPGTVSPFPASDGSSEQRYFNPRYIPRTTSRFAMGGIADGLSSAQSHLGSYSAGGRGRLLRGPGDGVSDSIPATIGGKQPARLADGEFVIPARIVSELGNGSTEAGSKQLYAMMDRIQAARRKTTGKTKVATNTKAHKLMPA